MIDKTRVIVVSTFAFLGVACITSGVVMPAVIKTEKKPTAMEITVTQKRVPEKAKTEIKLKDMESEINTPISVNIEDYLEYKLDSKILKKLKLDTSGVNITQAGTYTYTITYQKKIYNGSYVIKEKPLPTIDKLTLKTLKFSLGTKLSTDFSTYIIETIPEEAKIGIKLDLSNVNVNAAGTYQYSVTYEGKIYTGTIEIYEMQVIPAQEPKPTSPNENTTPDTEEKVEDNPTDTTQNLT